MSGSEDTPTSCMHALTSRCFAIIHGCVAIKNGNGKTLVNSTSDGSCSEKVQRGVEDIV